MRKTISSILSYRKKVNFAGMYTFPTELVGSLFFVLISLILTLLNIVKHVPMYMTLSTSILTVGFVIISILAYKRRVNEAKILILALTGVIFTIFALTGGNNGFAILWILLVPIIGSLWVGLRYGIIISGYFQVFLILLFYTPLANQVKDYYTPTFMLRFPLLYFATFCSITVLIWQRQELYEKLQQELYFDALTGLHNRRYYNELIDRLNNKGVTPDFIYYSVDINQLKPVNDQLGHKAGDELIQAAGRIIRETFPEAECCRIGGDEFVILATEHPNGNSLDALLEKTSQWRGTYKQILSISVGYASVSEDTGLSLDELSVLADSRMYEDKKQFYERNGEVRR